MKIAPLGFIHWNEDGDSTCVNCVNDILIDRLVRKNKQIKSLKAKLKAKRDGQIKPTIEGEAKKIYELKNAANDIFNVFSQNISLKQSDTTPDL